MADAIERQARAEAAARLLADPLLSEAFATFEQALLARALEAPARDDDGRRRCLDAVMTLRKVKANLESVIAGGKTAAINAARVVAPDPEQPRKSWFAR